MRVRRFKISVRHATMLLIFASTSCLTNVADAQSTKAPQTNSAVGLNSNLATIRQAQQQAVQQAQQTLSQTQNPQDRNNLQAAIHEMERAQAALDEAEKSPEKLPAALAAEQNAYQALLKISPRETRVRRSRNAQGNGEQQDRQQLDQLDLKQEENRYETERQASKPQNPQQREQSELLEKLKALAQRQQDLNERLRELQTALQAAKTEAEKEELLRQLKRLRDEERQMLAEMDQIRQQNERSNAIDSENRQRMEQTRSDMQRAAQEMEKESPSSALASGSRAQQSLQNLRDELRRQTSSQLTQQMRDLRNQARELSRNQEEIARTLDSMDQGRQTLDASQQGRDLAGQMQRQQSALTNLLANMRAVTEQTETAEPVLSRQLYDTLRRADQASTEELLRAGAQLAQRGFLQQAGETQNAARTNLNALRQDIERAAESVLGNEAESLRYAQRELDDLSSLVERELSGSANSNLIAGQRGLGQTNQLAQASQRGAQERSDSQANRAGQNGEPRIGAGEQQRQPGGQNPGEGQGESAQRAQAGSRGESQAANNRSGNASGSGGDTDRLSQIARQAANGGDGGSGGGPVTGNDFVNWSDRLRDVQLALDQPDLRNQLETVRERVAVMRREFRQQGRSPSGDVLRNEVLAPLAEVRVWLQQELARQQNPNSLVPLDRDPVPDNYSELVRKYYERLGSAK